MPPEPGVHCSFLVGAGGAAGRHHMADACDATAAAADLAYLRTVLNAWDPYSLIRGGAPEDEFDMERGRICDALVSGEARSAESLAGRIATIFEESFGGGFTASNCAGIAHTIWEWWQARRAVARG